MISTDGRKTTYREPEIEWVTLETADCAPAGTAGDTPAPGKRKVRRTGNTRRGVFRRAAAFVFAFSMLVTSVLTSWPQELGVFDLWSRFDESVSGDMIGETVQAVTTNWPQPGNINYIKTSECKLGLRDIQWVGRVSHGPTGAYEFQDYNNWTKLKDIIEHISPGISVLIDIDMGDFDPIGRETITIKNGQRIKIIASSPKTITRISDSNFESFFKVEEGGELCLGEGLTFNGMITRQWQGASYEEWVPVTESETRVENSAAMSFGNIGVRVMFGGYGFHAWHSSGGTRLGGFSTATGSLAPNIGLYTSANSFNYELKGNGTTAAGLPLSTASGPFYVLAFDSGVGIRPINFNDYTADGPAVSWNMVQFKNMSYEEKKPFLWELKQDPDGRRYLKNVASGLVLNYNGTTLETKTYTTLKKVTREGRWMTEDWALGSRDWDKFPGGAYFVRSSGVLSLDGAVFRDLYLPANGTAEKSDGTINNDLKGNNSAPIIIDKGEFVMYKGTITNNNIAYTANESHIISSGSNDQTNAVVPTFYDATGEIKKTNTGSAGAIIMNGGNATIYGGTIGTTTPATDAARLHFARNNLTNTTVFDG
ncbi:MAG: hypothetical protein IJP92_08900, partial [Lachnospiraceae bacterium]|nr:hypothetical protein [Lachnospiraceae bacterium]